MGRKIGPSHSSFCKDVRTSWTTFRGRFGTKLGLQHKKHNVFPGSCSPIIVVVLYLFSSVLFLFAQLRVSNYIYVFLYFFPHARINIRQSLLQSSSFRITCRVHAWFERCGGFVVLPFFFRSSSSSSASSSSREALSEMSDDLRKRTQKSAKIEKTKNLFFLKKKISSSSSLCCFCLIC